MRRDYTLPAVSNLQCEEIKGAQYEETVCSVRRVATAVPREGVK